MDEQMRLDMLLVARGLVSGRDRAKELIAQGQVLVNGQKATKAAQKYDADVPLEILNDAAHFVSRAAHKLEGALKSFGIDLSGRTVLDRMRKMVVLPSSVITFRIRNGLAWWSLMKMVRSFPWKKNLPIPRATMRSPVCISIPRAFPQWQKP